MEMRDTIDDLVCIPIHPDTSGSLKETLFGIRAQSFECISRTKLYSFDNFDESRSYVPPLRLLYTQYKI